MEDYPTNSNNVTSDDIIKDARLRFGYAEDGTDYNRRAYYDDVKFARLSGLAYDFHGLGGGSATLLTPAVLNLLRAGAPGVGHRVYTFASPKVGAGASPAILP